MKLPLTERSSREPIIRLKEVEVPCCLDVDNILMAVIAVSKFGQIPMDV